jgi:hypothetical protein
MIPYAEGAITSLRREAKLVLARADAEALARVLAGEAAPHESQVTAVYFDGPAAPLARRVAATPADCLKVRAKGYDPDRSLAPGRVVLEVKRERGGLTSKERTWLRREHVPDAVQGVLAPSHGPLSPLVATSYRRRVFQASPEWRVTMDDGLTFHLAGWNVFEPAAPPWPEALPEPFAAEDRVVVELKHAPDALPRWLRALARRGSPYSKFAEAVARASARTSSGAPAKGA